jgi:UDP-3-O-[3-hydroxymyristoyl] glucosamine N-acyltransferase
MQFTAQEIADLIGAVIEGDPHIKVSKLAKIEEADADSISFIANPKYLGFINTTKAAILIVNTQLEITEKPKATLLRVADPYSCFSTLLNLYNKASIEKAGIEANAFISESAVLGEGCYVASFAYISEGAEVGNNVKIMPGVYLGPNTKIGNNTILFANVAIQHNCEIGQNCILHPGVVIGSDGFGFAPQKDGTYSKVAQNGNVVVEDNVEIGANAAIDRGTMGSTLIKKGVKLDNMVHIAHNAEIGENTVIAAQSGVSGSTRIEHNVIVGGQVGFVGHLFIATGSQFGAQSGVTRSLNEPNKKYNGTPVQEYMGSMRSNATIKRLPELEKRIQELEKIIAQLQLSAK